MAVRPSRVRKPNPAPAKPQAAPSSPSRMGFYLAVFLFAYVGIVMAWLIVDYFVHVPRMPDPSVADLDLLDAYQNVHDLAVERIFKLFDLLIWKSFLPVLTAVLGFIFGSKTAEHGRG
jgi:hypothetical protein